MADVYERDVILVSRKMETVTDEDGNTSEQPTDNYCVDLPLTRAGLVEGLEDAYITNIKIDDGTLTFTYGDGHSEEQTINASSASEATHATSADTATSATTATTATKLGSSTVGSGTNPIYLDNGIATESSSTVGDSSTPVYLNNGVITKCSASLSGTGSLSSASTMGYCLLGDAMLEWGAGSYDNDTVTFNKAFSATPFIMITKCEAGSSHHLYNYSQGVNSSSKTQFTYDGGYIRWIAIGQV